MRRYLFVALPALALFGAASTPAQDAGGKPDDKGYLTIFDGKSLKGWKVSAMTGHSSASKNKSGGKWVIEDGAIVGCQDIPGNGGIVITEKKNDFGPDSGLFLRSNDRGQALQAMIDYHNNGNLMGVYGEGLNPGFHERNFSFTDAVTKIKEEPKSPFKLPVSPEEWPKFWKHGEWNELKARIEGNPAKITTWIKGVKFMVYTDTEKRLADKGGIALQVHGGGDYTKQFVRYRNIRVKELGKE
jgi:hypothetical protein